MPTLVRSKRHPHPYAPLLLLIVFWCTATCDSPAQIQPPPATPKSAAPDLTLAPVRWAEAASASQQRILQLSAGTPLRYRVRSERPKGVEVREVLETNEGNLARTVERNGQPLTTDENNGERQRLQDILDSPDSFLRRVRREEGSRTYAAELLRSMPASMVWTYVPGQPQLPGATDTAVVLDFRPDPSFKPPTLVTEALTGIAGRVWIDARTRCLTRIQGRILHPVDFGWGGVLARVREGGTVELEQRQITQNRWLYSHMIEHLTIREVLIHTVSEDSQMDVFDVQPLPAPMSYREGIQRLLALPVPTR